MDEKRTRIWKIVNITSWSVTKAIKVIPFPNCPRSVGTMPYSNRTLVDIETWYEEKIDKLNIQLKHYKKDLLIIKDKFRKTHVSDHS